MCLRITVIIKNFSDACADAGYSPTILSGQRLTGPTDIIKEPEHGGGALYPGLYRFLLLDDGVLTVDCGAGDEDVQPGEALLINLACYGISGLHPVPGGFS